MRTSLSACLLGVCFVAAFVSPADAQRQTPFEIENRLKRMEIQVGDLKRQALIFLPENLSEPVPLVFGFHGHGGNAINAARSFHLHQQWPEAVVVYMQGIPTPGKLTDPEGKKNGWQHGVGDQEDRDLKFFDAVLKEVTSTYPIDQSRIYSTGHSNGGGFTYLLWQERPEVFAAMAPSASAAIRSARELTPMPVMHLAGEKDTLVKFPWQQLTMELIKKINGCDGTSETWSENGTLYHSPEKHAPVVTYIHSGAHNYPREAPELIVRFFKEHQRSDKTASQSDEQTTEPNVAEPEAAK